MRVSESHALDALNLALFTVGNEWHLQPENPAAHHLLESGVLFSRAQLSRHTSIGAALIPLLTQVAHTSQAAALRAVRVHGVGGGGFTCSAWASPLTEGGVLLALDVVSNPASHAAEAHSAALMAGMLAHEIRNPLLAITGAAQLLKNAQADPTFCELITREAARIEALLKELDPLRGAADVPLDDVDIHQLLDEAIGSVKAGVAPHIRIVRHYDPSLPPLQADAARFTRALINLIKNAAEACVSVAQPEITLSTRYHVAQSARPVAIDITDNGEGISPEVATQLFRPFITTKREGRGLGLSIVARIVEDHGGRVELASARKGATSFRIWMPLVK